MMLVLCNRPLWPFPILYGEGLFSTCEVSASNARMHFPCKKSPTYIDKWRTKKHSLAVGKLDEWPQYFLNTLIYFTFLVFSSIHWCYLLELSPTGLVHLWSFKASFHWCNCSRISHNLPVFHSDPLGLCIILCYCNDSHQGVTGILSPSNVCLHYTHSHSYSFPDHDLTPIDTSVVGNLSLWQNSSGREY